MKKDVTTKKLSKTAANRRKFLKTTAAVGGAALGSGLLTGFPTIWAQNIKNVTFGSNSQDVFSVSDAAIVTSGTATLECAISNTPFVVIYKTSFISWFLAKRFLLVPWVSIVNILANKKIVQEFLQHQAKPKKIALAVSQLLENKTPLKNDLLKITKSLGPGKAYDKAVNFILNY